MDKIIKSLNSINNFSKNIIKYGSIIVLALCIIGACIICYNKFTVQEVQLYELGSGLIKSSTIVFAQVVIGGLIIDWFNTIAQNRD